MTFEESLYAYLSGYAGLKALVGKKVFPNVIPQKTELPAVVYNLITQDYFQSATEGNYGLVGPTYQVSVYARTYSNLKEIVAQVKASLVNYNGTMGGAGGVEIQGCFLVDENDSYNSGDGSEVHWSNIDFRFFYTL